MWYLVILDNVQSAVKSFAVDYLAEEHYYFLY